MTEDEGIAHPRVRTFCISAETGGENWNREYWVLSQRLEIQQTSGGPLLCTTPVYFFQPNTMVPGGIR